MKWILLVLALPAWSLGQAYSETGEEAEGSAPWQEIFVSDSLLRRDYEPGKFEKVVIVGDMNVVLAAGDDAMLSISGNRALMSQVGVRNWNDELTVSVDTGLLGPRERGKLEVTLPMVDAVRLEIRDGVGLSGSWNSSEPVELLARSGSTAVLLLRAPAVRLELTWNSRLTLSGTADTTRLTARDPVRADLTGFKTGDLVLEVRDNAEVLLGTTGTVEGRIYRGGILRAANPGNFREVHAGLRVDGEIRDIE